MNVNENEEVPVGIEVQAYSAYATAPMSQSWTNPFTTYYNNSYLHANLDSSMNLMKPSFS